LQVCFGVLQCVALCAAYRAVVFYVLHIGQHYCNIGNYCNTGNYCKGALVNGRQASLKHTGTHCNTLHTLQHTATHCNTLQHTATHCHILSQTATHYCNTGNHCNGTATESKRAAGDSESHCNTLRHTATCCNSLQLIHYTPPHSIALALQHRQPLQRRQSQRAAGVS